MEEANPAGPLVGVPACEKCHAGAMERATMPRLGGCLAAVGWILMAIAALLALSSFATCATTSSGSFVFTWFIVAMVGIGALIFLMSGRRVWKCPACGYFFQRA